MDIAAAMINAIQQKFKENENISDIYNHVVFGDTQEFDEKISNLEMSRIETLEALNNLKKMSNEKIYDVQLYDNNLHSEIIIEKIQAKENERAELFEYRDIIATICNDFYDAPSSLLDSLDDDFVNIHNNVKMIDKKYYCCNISKEFKIFDADVYRTLKEKEYTELLVRLETLIEGRKNLLSMYKREYDENIAFVHSLNIYRIEILKNEHINDIDDRNRFIYLILEDSKLKDVKEIFSKKLYNLLEIHYREVDEDQYYGVTKQFDPSHTNSQEIKQKDYTIKIEKVK